MPDRENDHHANPTTESITTSAQADCAGVLEAFAERIGRSRFARYFEHAAIARREGDALNVQVRSAFDADWLRRTFGNDLQDAAGALVVQWVVAPKAFACAEEASAPSTAPASGQVPPPKRPAAPSVSPDGLPHRHGPRYRLEDFVVGESNRLALMAAERFVDEPPAQHGLRQFLIYGGCAVGKTHVLNGIAARFREQHPGARVCCVTGEMFANEFITAVQAKKLDAFRRRYRRLDLLCVDDVQFLAGKMKTQLELLHTIEALDMDQGRLVLASDEHPKRIERMNARLVSRCVCGMVARLDSPERSLRARLAQRLAAQRGLTVDPTAAGVIADACAGSVREIEGAVVRLEAVARLEHRRGPIDAVLARRVLGRSDLMRPRKPISVQLVCQVVCAELNVELSEVLGRGRHRLVVLARSMVSLLSRELTTMSYPEIARALHRKNHSTVVTACQRMRRQMEEGREQDAGPLLGVMPLSDVFARLRDAIVRSAASGQVASVA